MIILLFATVLDGENPDAVGSGISDLIFGISQACPLDTRWGSAYIPIKLRRAAMRQSRILLARNIIHTQEEL